MSRRERAPERAIRPDSLYGDVIVAKVINNLIVDGKKQIAEQLLYDAIAMAEKKTGENGIDVFRRALENIKPVIEVKSRRIGGATYQVPDVVRPKRAQSLSIKWLIKHSRARHEKSMEQRLANEIMAAARSEGGAVGQKQQVHAMAEANKAFAHYNINSKR